LRADWEKRRTRLNRFKDHTFCFWNPYRT
jgi:hypothetical protein